MFLQSPIWMAPGSPPKSERFDLHGRGSWAVCAAPALEFSLAGLLPFQICPAQPSPTQLGLEPFPCLVIYKTQVEEVAGRVEICSPVCLYKSQFLDFKTD